jgi:fused signal recognition particle receptor
MGIFDRIKSGLQKTRNAFSGRMDELVESYKELDDDFYEDLTDILIMADVGVPTSELAVNRLKEKCKSEKIGDPAKAREKLGWNPRQTSFEQLVRIMVDADMKQVSQ